MDIKAEFERRLDLVKCENPNMSFQEQINLARERTQEAALDEVAYVADGRWAQHVDAVNRYHFE